MEQAKFNISFLSKDYYCWYIKEKELAIQVLNKYMEYDCRFGLDTETEALPEYKHLPKAPLSPHLSKIRLLQITNGTSVVVFDLKFIDDFSIFKPFLENKTFIAHNALFDLKFLLLAGCKHVDIHCTYLLAKILLHASRATDEGISLSLESCIEGFFQVPIVKEMGRTDWSVPDLNFEQVEYAALDAVYVRLLAETLAPVVAQKKLLSYYKLLKEVQYPIAEMELNGISLDTSTHIEMYHKWRTELYQIKKKLIGATGLQTITPQKIADWLESNLDAKTLALWPRSEKTNKLSVDANVLADFSYVPLVAPFAEFQKKLKLTTSFGFNLTEMINPKTKRVHPSYHINGARSGRFSCSSPNVQQIPRDKDIRQLFIPGKDNVFVVADFGQIELRVCSELSRDPAMLNAYRNGIDLHALTAATVSRKNIKDITKEDRQKAKSINFGFAFGLGAKKFKSYAHKSYKVDVTQEEADEALRVYRELYAGYHEYQKRQAELGATTLKVVSPLGKIRKLEAGNSYGSSLNHGAQSGAAEIMMCSLVRVQKELISRKMKAKFSFSVHDEIGLEAPKNEASIVKTILEECMVKGFLDVFPKGITRGLVEAHIGENWYAAK